MNPRETCETIIKALVKEGYRYQVSQRDLEKSIMEKRGIDERTINRWIKALTTFGYVKRETPQLFSLVPTAIPELVSLLQTKPQTKVM